MLEYNRSPIIDKQAAYMVRELRQFSEVAADEFQHQFHAIRGPYERESWDERIVATIEFYATHFWDGVRWRVTS